MNVIAWLVLYLVLTLIAELVFEFTDTLSHDRELKPAAVAWFLLLGLVGGVSTGGLLPDRMLPPGPFTGVSVVILPVVLGAGMAIVGAVRRPASSHLASWYGGTALGLGLAVGRLVGLAFVAQVRAV